MRAGFAIGPSRMQFGLEHHSDRGVQYATRDYIALLIEHGMRISMSRRGNPYDNALAESFIKTLKYEEVHRQEYRDLPEARASIPRFFEQVYNQKRLHPALGYLPPAEFEKLLGNFAIGRPQKGDLWLLEHPGPGRSRLSQVQSSVLEIKT
jgi:putative transposase